MRSLEPPGCSLIASQKDWEVVGKRGRCGDVEIKIGRPGIAVRIDVPRELLAGRKENEMSFPQFDLSNDHYFCSVLDE